MLRWQPLSRKLRINGLNGRGSGGSNRNWDAGLTVATSLLTLTTKISGVEGLILDAHRRKIRIGILGGLVVAIQSIGNAFPVKQRAGGNRLLYSQARTRKSKIGYFSMPNKLMAVPHQIRDECYNLLIEVSRIEA
ncbi:MAG: hypothetical protein ACOVQK_12245 [Cyanobium sp.]